MGILFRNPILVVGQQLKPNTVVGTVGDQGNNSHLHLVVRDELQGGRSHNPYLYFDDSLKPVPFKSSYPQGHSLESMESFVYGAPNYWTDGDSKQADIRYTTIPNEPELTVDGMK
jgi:murein DD-endopeptidase MepM/ murein hydrolase activator NlpD